jgi:hypothetical protein
MRQGGELPGARNGRPTPAHAGVDLMFVKNRGPKGGEAGKRRPAPWSSPSTPSNSTTLDVPIFPCCKRDRVVGTHRRVSWEGGAPRRFIVDVTGVGGHALRLEEESLTAFAPLERQLRRHFRSQRSRQADERRPTTPSRRSATSGGFGRRRVHPDTIRIAGAAWVHPAAVRRDVLNGSLPRDAPKDHRGRPRCSSGRRNAADPYTSVIEVMGRPASPELATPLQAGHPNCPDRPMPPTFWVRDRYRCVDEPTFVVSSRRECSSTALGSAGVRILLWSTSRLPMQSLTRLSLSTRKHWLVGAAWRAVPPLSAATDGRAVAAAFQRPSPSPDAAKTTAGSRRMGRFTGPFVGWTAGELRSTPKPASPGSRARRPPPPSAATDGQTEPGPGWSARAIFRSTSRKGRIEGPVGTINRHRPTDRDASRQAFALVAAPRGAEPGRR